MKKLVPVESNDDLLHQVALARHRGNHDAVKHLNAAIDEYQAECPHPFYMLRRSRFIRNQLWCRRCHKILGKVNVK